MRLRKITLWKSIKGKVFLFSIITLAFALTALSIFILEFFKSQLLRDKRVENLRIAEHASNIVELYMDNIINRLHAIHLYDLFDESSYPKGERELVSLLEDVEHAQLFLITDIQGSEFLRVSRQESVPGDLLDEINRQEKLEAVQQGKTYIGQVFSTSSEFPMMEISVPIRSDEKAVLGILTSIISLKGIFRELDKIDLSTSKEIYIIDRNGWGIAYISKSHSQKNIPGTEKISEYRGDLGHIMKVQQYMSGISELSLRKPLIYKNILQKEVLGTLVTCPKIKWGVIVEEDLSFVFAPIAKMKKKYLIGVGVIFLILSILAAIITKLITSPLIRLYKSTEALGEEMEKISIKGNDEIGRIAQNINQLIKILYQKDEDLRRRYQELESVSKEFEHSYNQFEGAMEDLEASKSDLLKQKYLFSKIIESVKLLIVGLDLEGQVVIYNKECEEKLLFKIHEAKGKDWFYLVYPPDRYSNAKALFNKLLENKSYEVLEDQILDKDGHTLKIAWHFSVINNPKGVPEFIILIGEDLGDRQRREEELLVRNHKLMKNNEELENILSIVSHDLKNPLYIIQDFASIILQDYKEGLSEDGLYYLERIKANARHMEKLIMDVLELSRSTRIKGVWQECSISEVVSRAVDEFKEIIKTKGIQVSISKELPTCMCEPERILRVFMNLISNCAKFINNTKKTTIQIGYIDRENEYEFYVKDNGIGIDREYHDKIFVIFQRIQDVKDVEGTGVGLTIVKRIVENHGGRVWVESKKGEGATFYFTLPKKAPQLL